VVALVFLGRKQLYQMLNVTLQTVCP